MPVGADGRVHTTFTRNASTLRLTSVGPNLQNIPRSAHGGEKAYVKQMFCAPSGHKFWARDYSGIEAVLVGVFANSALYTRLAKIDIHTYFTAYKLSELDHAFPSSDLPQPSWSDSDLRSYLGQLKGRYKADRQALKHVGHSANYMGGAHKIQEILLKELGKVYPIKDIQKMIDLYYALFPEIPAWHSSLCQQVDSFRRGESPDGMGGTRTGVCYVKNPYGFPMRFHNVLEWSRVGEEWIWEYGKDAKALVASLPQSTAAFIYCEAALALDEEYPEVGETLRLLVHDELLGEASDSFIAECLMTAKAVMERPIKEIPLNPAWGLGPLLVVGTEGKVGTEWGNMKEIVD
jgi:hypothetical protein